MKNYKQQIHVVLIFRNGMVVVCDQNGNQMPFFQGPKSYLVMKRIKYRISRQANKKIRWIETI